VLGVGAGNQAGGARSQPCMVDTLAGHGCHDGRDPISGVCKRMMARNAVEAQKCFKEYVLSCKSMPSMTRVWSMSGRHRKRLVQERHVGEKDLVHGYWE
jgi:hypothetical protein